MENENLQNTFIAPDSSKYFVAVISADSPYLYAGKECLCDEEEEHSVLERLDRTGEMVPMIIPEWEEFDPRSTFARTIAYKYVLVGDDVQRIEGCNPFDADGFVLVDKLSHNQLLCLNARKQARLEVIWANQQMIKQAQERRNQLLQKHPDFKFEGRVVSNEA